MRTVFFETAGDFLQAARDYLEADQVINSLILGIAERASRSDNPPAEQIFAAVYDGEAMTGAAVMSGFYLLLTGRPALVDDLAKALVETGIHLPGVMAPGELSEAFAQAWTAASGGTFERDMTTSIFELTAVNPPTYAPGQMRPATADDIPLIAGWIAAFQAEAAPHEPPRDTTATARQRVEGGALYLWEDGGQAVSMAATARPSAHGITVNLVYTPPELRGQGYATSCVARLSQQMLDSGYRFCTLFADQNNPTSTGIYRRIGYRPVGDFHSNRFDAPEE